MPDGAPNNSFATSMAGWPLWVKIVATFGFSTAVAGYLLYYVVSTNTQNIRDQAASAGAHNQVTMDIRDSIKEQKATLTWMLYTLQVMCQHSAKTDTEHRECVVVK